MDKKINDNNAEEEAQRQEPQQNYHQWNPIHFDGVRDMLCIMCDRETVWLSLYMSAKLFHTTDDTNSMFYVYWGFRYSLLRSLSSMSNAGFIILFAFLSISYNWPAACMLLILHLLCKFTIGKKLIDDDARDIPDHYDYPPEVKEFFARYDCYLRYLTGESEESEE